MEKEKCRHLKLAIQQLAQQVYKQGGLFNPSQSDSISGREGILAHQKLEQHLSQHFSAASIKREFSLCSKLNFEAVQFTLTGRLDLLLLDCPKQANKFTFPEQNYPPATPTDHLPLQLIEVKTYRQQIPEEENPVHWAQAKLYAFILWQSILANETKETLPPNIVDHYRHKKKMALRVLLYYVQTDQLAYTIQAKNFTFQELELFAEQTCKAYLKLTQPFLNGLQHRNEMAKTATFPYPDLRDGQKYLMQQIVGISKAKDILIAQAPTGIGKTMASLYPAVKALAHHYFDRIFYLTAMSSTRHVAEDALKDLENCGFSLRYITLYAKESLCLQPDMYCDQTLCPYAQHYYDQLPSALHEIFQYHNIHQNLLLEMAQKYQLCPFELALDIANYCDVIICDYNYVFDPRVKLDRFFNHPESKNLLLVDEAHNLPQRACQMFSASLTESELTLCLHYLKPILKVDPKIEPLLLPLGENLLAYMKKLKASLLPLGNMENGFLELEPQVLREQLIHTEHFTAMRPKPVKLLALVAQFYFFLGSFLKKISVFPERQQLQKIWFSLRFFCRIAEDYYSDAYATFARIKPDPDKNLLLELELNCLDSSIPLTECYWQKHPTVFFSATLSPYPYFARLLDAKYTDFPPENLMLPSPFPEENRLILACTTFSLRYKDRSASLPHITAFLLQIVQQHVGNYLVFLPSFSYLQALRRILKTLTLPAHLDFMLQTPQMSEALKKKFLARFQNFGQKTLVAFAVIGSLFNEGIDLKGDQLSGVIILGTGLPKLSPEREIMRQYYEERLGHGYDYAYLYPGFNKIQQAAGRLIRSDKDKGFILLIDDRYQNEPYPSLFPEDWRPEFHQDPTELLAALENFWLTFSSPET